jgi:hypothetical protein
MADEVRDERIDIYLNILSSGSMEQQKTMLNRLQWSGLSASRLFDVIEKSLMDQYLESNLSNNQVTVLAYMARSLGYSGNEKYRSTLSTLSQDAFPPKIKRHAGKALRDLQKFSTWNALIENNDLDVEGKNSAITTYMKMLDVNDVFVQRLAARAMFHEHLRDPDLLALAANKLESLYLKSGLDGEEQDTAAWLCKAIGQSGQSEYINVLVEIASKTPYNKIRRYAQKYTR